MLQRQPVDVPRKLKEATITYDPVLRSMILVGGDLGNPGWSTLNERVWALHPTRPAEFLRFGTACPGSTGAPSLAAQPNAWPWSGASFTVEVNDVPPSAAISLAFGASASQWGGLSLPVALPGTGSPGCSASISLDVVVPVLNTGSGGSLTLGIPTNASLIGQAYYNQAVVLDPGANALGLTTSNAACARIGAR